MAPPPTIIRKLTCEEHRCRIFSDLKMLERANEGKLRWNHDPIVPKRAPWPDHNGKLLTHNGNAKLLDDAFPPPDPRHIAAKVHWHIASDGTIGASGKYDPKSITTPGGIRYQPIPPDQPDAVCELCESGDIISPWKRHYNSTYRPGILHCLKVWIRAIMKS